MAWRRPSSLEVAAGKGGVPLAPSEAEAAARSAGIVTHVIAAYYRALVAGQVPPGYAASLALAYQQAPLGRARG